MMRLARLGTTVALASVVGACAEPTSAAPAGVGLRFVDIPTAYVFPDDDVDDDTAGLQVAVAVAVDRAAADGDDLGDVTIVGPVGTVTGAVDDDDTATLVVTLPTLDLPGATTTLTATIDVDGATVSARRDVVARNARPQAPPPETPVSCTIDIADNGDATVGCVGGDTDHPTARNLARGGLITLRVSTVPLGEEPTLTRAIQAELEAGGADVAFPFDASGTYGYTAVLSGSAAVTGATVSVSTTADVIRP